MTESEWRYMWLGSEGFVAAHPSRGLGPNTAVLKLNDTAGDPWVLHLNTVDPMTWALQVVYRPDTVAEVFDEWTVAADPYTVMCRLVRSLHAIRTPEPELVGADLS